MAHCVHENSPSLLGLALVAFPLTARYLPCGSGRVRCEVSVRRPLYPL